MPWGGSYYKRNQTILGDKLMLDWHSWKAGEAPGTNDPIIRPHGSLCKESENKGDGNFCQLCRNIGKYSWIDYPQTKPCPGIARGWHE